MLPFKRTGHRASLRARPALRACAALLAAGACLALHPGARSQERAAPRAGMLASALVTDVAGTVRVEHQGRSRALEVLDTFGPGDQLRLGPDGRAEIVVLQPVGRAFRLAGEGRFALRDGAMIMLGGTGSLGQRDLQGEWAALRVDGTHLGRASVSMRGAPDSTVALRAPLGAQLPGQPTELRWDRPYGRRSAQWSFDVRLVDGAGALVFATQTRATSVALPPLAWTPGSDYLWSVSGTDEQGRRAAGAAEFHVLGAPLQARIAELAAGVARARSLESGAAVPEAVLYALALEQAGLADEAARQWQALAGERPQFSARAAVGAAGR